MKHGSLFSGIGGFELAAVWAGWENIFHCEINPFGRKVLNYYWPKSISYEDITTTDFTIHRGHIDIITGGFPCQPFSLAGKRKGTEDERHLWPEMLRVIREVQPKWVVGENVFGLINWDGGLVFDQVQTDLETEGYEVQAYVLPACAVNAPHRRDRVWFVGHYKNDRWDKNNSGFRGLQLSKSMEMEESQGVCRQNSQSRRETQKLINAQGTHECSEGGGSRSHQQEQIRQPKRESENSGSLYQLTQQGEGVWCTQAKGEEQMVCSNICEQCKNPHRLFRYERRSDCCQNECGDKEWTTPNSDIRRLERPTSVGRNGKYVVGESESRTASDTSNTGLPWSERRKSYGKTGWKETYDATSKRFKIQSWNEWPTQSPVCRRTNGVSTIMVRNINPEIYGQISKRYTDKDLQEVWKTFQSEEIREQIGRLYKIHEPGLLFKVLQLCSPTNYEQKGISLWSEKTSEKLLRKLWEYGRFADTPQGRELEKQFRIEFNNTLPYLSHEVALVTMEVERASESFASWHRNESIKAYGNAIVPQVAYQIFKAINEYVKL